MNSEEIFHQLDLKAKEYGEAKGDAEYLREFRKSKKAILIQEAQRNGLKTAQERESYAYAHEEYVYLLEGLKVAVERSERLRIEIKVLESRVDVWRSKNARAVAEMKLR